MDVWMCEDKESIEVIPVLDHPNLSKMGSSNSAFGLRPSCRLGEEEKQNERKSSMSVPTADPRRSDRQIKVLQGSSVLRGGAPEVPSAPALSDEMR